MKYNVTAPNRTTLGFTTYCCAGRHWTGGGVTTIEVVDQDECPRIPHPLRLGVKMLDPVRLGRLAWKEVLEDDQLTKNPAPDDAKLSVPEGNPTEQLKEENRELRTMIASLTKRLGALEQASAGVGASPSAHDDAQVPAAADEPAAETESTGELPPAAAIPARSRRGKGG